MAPLLRERKDVIGRLARHFLAFAARAQSRAPLELSTNAEAALRADLWPGNIRELKNVMERVAILWPGRIVEVDALPARMRSNSTAMAPAMLQIGGDVTLEALEEEHLRRVAARTKTQEEAAAIRGIDASTLWRKRRKLGLD